MDGLAVIGAVFFLIVVGYVGVSAVLRRIPATSLRLPTGPIPDTWDAIVEHNVPLARGRGVPVAAPSRGSVLSDAPDGARVSARIRPQVRPVSQDRRDRTTPRAP